MLDKVRLVAFTTDGMGYTTLVFRKLENIGDSRYVMCVMFPNWNQDRMRIDDVGILDYREVVAGKDTWFNGETDVPYRYSMIIFNKFVPLKEDSNEEFIMR